MKNTRWALPLLTILMASLAEGRDAETAVKKEFAVSAAEGRHSGVDLVLHFNTQNTVSVRETPRQCLQDSWPLDRAWKGLIPSV